MKHVLKAALLKILWDSKHLIMTIMVGVSELYSILRLTEKSTYVPKLSDNVVINNARWRDMSVRILKDHFLLREIFGKLFFELIEMCLEMLMR